MVKVGVVGLGIMGQHHARVYSELNCSLAGVADINPERAKEIGRHFNVPYFTDYRELLGSVDAVSIAVPTTFHHPVAMDFLNRSVHCLVEKPIAFDMDEAREMVGTAARKNANLAVGLIERFNPAVIKLKELIDQGALGDLLIISSRRVSPFVSRISDTGAVMDTAIHDIGVAKYLTGREPISIFSRVGSEKNSKGDYAVVVLDFGTTEACIEVNWFTPQKARTLVATGSNGVAYLNYVDQSLRIEDGVGNHNVIVEKAEPLKVELTDFLNSIREGRKPAVDGAEGAEVLKISLESSRSNFCSLYEMAR